MGDHFGDCWFGMGFPFFCLSNLSFLARCSGGEEAEKRLESGSPLSLLDSLAQRNRVTFDSENFSTHKMKSSFICNLWS